MIPRRYPPIANRPATVFGADEQQLGYDRKQSPPRKRSNMGIERVSTGDDYTPDEIEFMLAMDRYKRDAHRPYPDCRDVLIVARKLGYRKEGNATHETP